MLTKDKVISGIKRLPDSVTIEEILDQIILLEKIEKGIDQADRGEVFTEEQVEAKVAKWFA
jgi:predicted transcriptional regulator